MRWAMEIAVGLSNVVVNPEGGASIGIQLTSTAGTVSVTGIANAMCHRQCADDTAGRGTVETALRQPARPDAGGLAGLDHQPVCGCERLCRGAVRRPDLRGADPEQTSLTVTAMTDNLGHSYTALNAGSDSGRSPAAPSTLSSPLPAC